MKRIYLLVIVFFLTIMLFFVSRNDSLAMLSYETPGFASASVTASVLNVRQGPGTQYKVVTQVKKNATVRVFAKIGNWYVVQTDDNHIGAVSKDYIKGHTSTGGATTSTGNSGSNTTTTTISDEDDILNRINAERKKAGLPALIMDKDLQKVAKVKAQDMVKNNYFSHTSPTYGSPFDMMKSYGITYKVAGENIAGNSTNAGAVSAWMASSGHKENILNNAYNYTGIGVVSSQKYGKIYVQMFVGR